MAILFRVTLRFRPQGPAVTGEWGREESARLRYSAYMDLYGERAGVTIYLEEENTRTQDIRVLATWPQQAPEHLGVGVSSPRRAGVTSLTPRPGIQVVGVTNFPMTMGWSFPLWRPAAARVLLLPEETGPSAAGGVAPVRGTESKECAKRA